MARVTRQRMPLFLFPLFALAARFKPACSLRISTGGLFTFGEKKNHSFFPPSALPRVLARTSRVLDPTIDRSCDVRRHDPSARGTGLRGDESVQKISR